MVRPNSEEHLETCHSQQNQYEHTICYCSSRKSSSCVIHMTVMRTVNVMRRFHVNFPHPQYESMHRTRKPPTPVLCILQIKQPLLFMLVKV